MTRELVGWMRNHMCLVSALHTLVVMFMHTLVSLLAEGCMLSCDAHILLVAVLQIPHTLS